MKAKSRRGASHSHTEGVTINFWNGFFETENQQEIHILEKYDGVYWNIISEEKVLPKPKVMIPEEEKPVNIPKPWEVVPDVPEIKPRVDLSGMSRAELWKLSKKRGYEGKYFDSTKEGLIKFLEEN